MLRTIFRLNTQFGKCNKRRSERLVKPVKESLTQGE